MSKRYYTNARERELFSWSCNQRQNSKKNFSREKTLYNNEIREKMKSEIFYFEDSIEFSNSFYVCALQLFFRAPNNSYTWKNCSEITIINLKKHLTIFREKNEKNKQLHNKNSERCSLSSKTLLGEIKRTRNVFFSSNE